MHILVTGATGFIGKALCPSLLEKGYSVSALGRSKDKIKRTFGDRLFALTDLDPEIRFDAVINLAGENIASAKWSEQQKNKILQSRIHATRVLVDHFTNHHKPDVFISASAIGYYGAWADEPLSEDSGFHDGFTHDLCAAWEKEALRAEILGIRTCITRLGIVLEKNGGALAKMIPPFYLGMGGVIGSGNQYMSWVHREDVIRAFGFLLENKDTSGIYNLTAPVPVTNTEFTRILARAMKRPALISMPAPVVKMIWGEMGEELLLKGQRVIPERLQKSGFQCRYSVLADALQAFF